MTLVQFSILLLGVLVGGAVAWLGVRARAASLNSQVTLLTNDLATTRSQLGLQQEANAQLREKVATLTNTLQLSTKANEDSLERLREMFGSLAADALRNNNQSFLELAKANLEKFQGVAKSDLEARQKAVEHLVMPIQESLSKVDQKIQQIEKDRTQAYGALSEQVQSLIGTQEQLRTETGNLVKALRAPSVRGRWGEIQLRRVVEIAGMLSYCDFSEQETLHTSEGRMRPDLIVKLPGGKNVVVDAKTPLQAYLEAIEATDDGIRNLRLVEHARQVRDHMTKLSSKAYWEQFEASPEFVVMFLPGETFFSAALEQDPGLIEQGVAWRVIPASPTTLIALLKAVAYGWNQEKLARNAQEISMLGKELHDRLRSLFGHLDAAGKNLDRAVESYNKAVGTLESRVMVSARKFGELGAAITEEIPEIEPIETTARTLSLDWGEDDTITLDLPSAPPRRTGSDG
jgi:DNA recombination protein RmuC